MLAATLSYTDDEAPAVVAELAKFARRHPGMVLFSTARAPLPGLPAIAPDTPTTYLHYRLAYQLPWGIATRAQPSAGTYPHLAYLPLYCLARDAAHPATDPLPTSHIPALGAALVNPVTGLTRLYPGDGTAPDFSLDTPPVWTRKLALPRRWIAGDVLTRVRQALVRAGLPLYPGTLFVEPVDGYPWMRDRTPLAPATVRSKEMAVPLIGYAIDEDTQEVIYLNMVGHKTATRSLWGSLNTHHQRTITVDDPLTGPHRAYSSHHYATFSTPLDPDTGLIRLMILDKRALAPHVESLAYLILPQTLAPAAADRAFAARLNAVLPLGILPAWGHALRERGADRQLVRSLTAGGDAGHAYALDADAAWQDVIVTALHAGAITIPEDLGTTEHVAEA